MEGKGSRVARVGRVEDGRAPPAGRSGGDDAAGAGVRTGRKEGWGDVTKGGRGGKESRPPMAAALWHQGQSER